MYSIIIFSILGVVLLQTHPSESLCSVEPISWLNNNRTCPRNNAICGTIHQERSVFANGTTCRTTKTESSCMCPGNQICPFNNPDHLLFSMPQHTQVLCRPACDIDRCEWRRRPNHVFGMAILDTETHFTSPVWVVNCRCPRHHTPLTDSVVHQSRWAFRVHTPSMTDNQPGVQLICRGRRREYQEADPCASSAGKK